MSVLQVLFKRVALGFAAAWAAVTAIFFAFTLSDDWVEDGIEGAARFGGADEAEIEARIEAYRAERGLDRPISEQYVDYMIQTAQLDFGPSFSTGEPAGGLMLDAAIRTAMYALPAIALAIALGMSIGFYAAFNPHSRVAGLLRHGSYVAFAAPTFWVGGVAVGLTQTGTIEQSHWLFRHALPIALATTTLLGGYVSYSRAYALEERSKQFVSLVRAKGARPLLVARHVVRNAAIPLFSMLFTEALALLVLSVFVIEFLFGIEGFGWMFVDAISTRDLPMILAGTVIVIIVGVLGNIIQDLSYSYLDPRVGDGSR